MKIRALTVGQKVPFLSENSFFEKFLEEKLYYFDQLNKDFKDLISSEGIEIQSIRFCTQPILTYENKFREWNLDEIISRLHEQLDILENLTNKYGINYYACAMILAEQQMEKYGVYEKLLLNEVPRFIRKRERFFTSLSVASSERGINLSALRSGAKIIKELSIKDPFDNLKFCISTNVKPDTPFFPAAYHLSDNPSFSVAMELADEVVEVFSNTKSFSEAQLSLKKRFLEIYDLIGSIGEKLAEKNGIEFMGIDFSPAPYPTVEKSIGTAIEKLNFEYFGSPGSLIAVAMIKNAIPQLGKVIGFSGFMPSVLEDYTIATRLAEQKFNLDTLLLYSTMCGTGLDCVPLPGDITQRELFYILLDVCTISIRLNKPLTARLMPIPGRSAGEEVKFNFEYFANSKVMDVRRISDEIENDLFNSKEKNFKFLE
ncbi:MAG: DUF711 family protein [Promethearchaeota archaeon]